MVRHHAQNRVDQVQNLHRGLRRRRLRADKHGAALPAKGGQKRIQNRLTAVGSQPGDQRLPVVFRRLSVCRGRVIGIGSCGGIGHIPRRKIPAEEVARHHTAVRRGQHRLRFLRIVDQGMHEVCAPLSRIIPRQIADTALYQSAVRCAELHISRCQLFAPRQIRIGGRQLILAYRQQLRFDKGLIDSRRAGKGIVAVHLVEQAHPRRNSGIKML